MFLERNAIYIGNDGNLYKYKRQNFAKAVYLFESDIDDLFKEVDFGD